MFENGRNKFWGSLLLTRGASKLPIGHFINLTTTHKHEYLRNDKSYRQTENHLKQQRVPVPYNYIFVVVGEL